MAYSLSASSVNTLKTRSIPQILTFVTTEYEPPENRQTVQADIAMESRHDNDTSASTNQRLFLAVTPTISLPAKFVPIGRLVKCRVMDSNIL